jgi:hypothetical protein
MAVVYSGFSYYMEVVAHGFVTDITKTNIENEERLHALINKAEGPVSGWWCCLRQRCFP